MENFYKQGITVIELLIVLAVLSIIFSIALPQFAKIKENQVLKNGVQDVISSINKARGQTLASLNSSVYGVHFQSDKVIIFKGTIFIADTVGNETISLTLPAIISTITLPGGATDFYFNRLSGTPSFIGSGTIVISTTNFNKTITISGTGGVSSN